MISNLLAIHFNRVSLRLKLPEHFRVPISCQYSHLVPTLQIVQSSRADNCGRRKFSHIETIIEDTDKVLVAQKVSICREANSDHICEKNTIYKYEIMTI